jgi:3-phenylpropionate/trans-cinnamate dioxygenase ferredoxin reductase subunit
VTRWHRTPAERATDRQRVNGRCCVVCAAGDVAKAYHPLLLGRRIRVEHWANTLNQPALAAKMMIGEEATYDRLPYFYTDHYDLGMEDTGYAEPDDGVVIRGDLHDRGFFAFWLPEGRVVAGMDVNVWDVTSRSRTCSSPAHGSTPHISPTPTSP